MSEPLTPLPWRVRDDELLGPEDEWVATFDTPEDAAYVLATLDAVRATSEGLDVERLARALKQADDTQGLNGYREWAERIAREYATLDAVRSTSEGLRELFARYIEYHGEPSEWDHDGGWCLKHLPTVAEVRAALRSEDEG